MPGPASTLAFCWWGRLAGTTSAPVGPWCLCCLGHLSSTPSAPADVSTSIGSCLVCLGLAQHLHRWGLGAPGCLEQSRHMLVLLEAPVSHTISTNEALVLSDAWTSIGSRLMMIGAPGWDNVRISEAVVRQGASSYLGSCLCNLGHLSGTPSPPTGPGYERMPRPASTHILCV